MICLVVTLIYLFTTVPVLLITVPTTVNLYLFWDHVKDIRNQTELARQISYGNNKVYPTLTCSLISFLMTKNFGCNGDDKSAAIVQRANRPLGCFVV